jgi:hypothetical protein
MASAALISVTPWLAPSLSMSWTSRTRISSLVRGPSFGAGCADLIGRRMGSISLCLLQRAVHNPFCGPRKICIRGLLFGKHGRSGVSVNKSTTLRVARIAESVIYLRRPAARNQCSRKEH